MLKITKTPSGITVVTYKIDRETASCVLRLKAGYRYEKTNEKGLSHFLEHELFEGTESYPTAKDFRQSITSLGGGIDAGTGYEETFYQVKILSKHIDQAITTLSEQIGKPLLTPESINKEKEIIKQEMNQRKDDPDVYLRWHLVNETLWPGQDLTHPLGGEVENIALVTKKSIQSYLKKFYTKSNLVVCVVGNFNHEEIVKKIEVAFHDLPQGEVVSHSKALERPGFNLVAEARATNQTKLCLAYFAPPRNSQNVISMLLLADVLGERIFYRLVYDLGFAYSVNCVYEEYQDTGKLVITAGFANGQVKKFIELIGDEIRNLSSADVTSSELERAKTRKLSSLAFANENVADLANNYSFRVAVGIEPVSLEGEVKLISEVTSKDILQTAKKYLQNDPKIAMVGPTEDIKTLENLYGQKKSK